ncbi:hypothetical protein [Neobacillus kokaensis]|uniref:DUF3324 domain-containing protein n=1 Tax=Neobacillus kokaensis TaxID=2759023 RepID=A0ABQ3N433_9BACI|nr:hypothetical protein [Neobacillus kokaensis]GHH98292.1 hypothetical protein AM1BK_18350 [Neobacillus kokaensis]
MRNHKLLFFSIIIFTFILIISFVQIRGTKADETVYNVDISTTPSEGFLIADNMAPGDKKTSILKVSNNGNLDFNYSVSSRQETGDLVLYNRILLKVSDVEGNLYEGTLNDFLNFALGTIAIGESDTLTFTAELPIETGNELQGKSTNIAFDFSAVGHEEQIPIGDQCYEPPFVNRNFTLHQKSTVPIKFHLRNEYGNLENELLQNVRLEVTGPSGGAGTVNYVFTPKDGTLDFQKVNPPHYHARFSTFDYPVMDDQWYTATVYVDNKEYCEKTFQVLKSGNRSNAE